MTKDEFELAFRRTQDEGGHSYDPWSIECNWRNYQKHPEQYEWLQQASLTAKEQNETR